MIESECHGQSNFKTGRRYVKMKTVDPYNHKSLQGEHSIKSLSTILTKHLTGQGETWHKFLLFATFAYNTLHSPNIGNYSPFKLTFG